MKLSCALLVLAFAPLVTASTLALSPVLIYHEYQQTSNDPCLIGDTSCNNGTFPETVFPANVSSYDALSPVYTVGDILAITGGPFAVGVDVNQTDVNQTLSLFTMSINGTVVDTFSSDPAIQVPPTAGGGNGNGYADYMLTGFSNLSLYNVADTVQFHVVMPLVNDGREQYFLIPQGAAVPEPTTFLLGGLGLLVFYALRRRIHSAQRQ
jgi:PEP-CTERM motif